VLGVGDDFGEAGSAAAVNGRVDELNARLSRFEAGREHHSPLGACRLGLGIGLGLGVRCRVRVKP